MEEWRRPRSESSTGADTDSIYMHGNVYGDHHRRKRPFKFTSPVCKLCYVSFLPFRISPPKASIISWFTLVIKIEIQ
ncbi:hypothetical protein JTB14_002344 [Gonioctena quinquepunctata]|nr:hypothetical protein JTB14_002344 [Gonioctena quinquepunctata]